VTGPPDVGSAAFQHDLHANCRRLRDTDPVHAHVFHGETRWTLLRYDDVAAAFRDDRFAALRIPADVLAQIRASGIAELEALAELEAHSLAVLDPPEHGRVRGQVGRAFTPRAVENLRAGIERVAHRLLDAAAREGGADLLARFAVPLTVVVIGELVGVAPADRARLKHWSDAMVPLMDRSTIGPGLVKAAAALHAFTAYVKALVEERRRAPRNDLASALVHGRDGRGALDDAELVATIVLLFGAGHETSTNLIGNGVHALLDHPDQLALLRADPSRIPAAIEEMLRFESPLQRAPRRLAEEVELRGVRLPKGATVFLHMSAANRDPARFADPDRFDVLRADGAHLAFGGGAHFCMGAQLARLEAEIALRALLERFPRLRRAPETRVAWRPSSFLRGLQSLPVRFS
jgi:cytochrome P450